MRICLSADRYFRDSKNLQDRAKRFRSWAPQAGAEFPSFATVAMARFSLFNLNHSEVFKFRYGHISSIVTLRSGSCSENTLLMYSLVNY